MLFVPVLLLVIQVHLLVVNVFVKIGFFFFVFCCEHPSTVRRFVVVVVVVVVVFFSTAETTYAKR